MPYRKQISYLELRENGQRVKNVGFARLVSLEKEDILTLQVNGLTDADTIPVQCRLRWDSGDKAVDELTAEGGNIFWEKRFPGEEKRERIRGIRLLIDKNREICGGFPADPVSEVSTGSFKPEPENIRDSKREEEDREIQENKSTEKTERSERKESAERKERSEKNESIKKETSAAERKTVSTLHMMDTKWEQLSSIYRHIHPFRDDREFLSVGPEDFVILQERCYPMTHNSFLLHGYYNYRHLLLMRRETADQVKYYIGVPGNFYEREKQVARMFGFESFEGSREPSRDGDFGYYMISVEL